MINKINSNTRDKSSMVEYLKVGNMETQNAKEIATEFAKYFSTVGTTYANSIDQPNTNTHTYLSRINSNPTFST